MVMAASFKKLYKESYASLDEETKAKFEELQAKVQQAILRTFKEPIEVEFDKADKKNHSNYPRLIIHNLSKDSKTYQDFLKTNNIVLHIELLYKNSLISLLSTVEWFYSQILHYFYSKHPESAGIGKKTLTLADLKQYDTIADAEKHLIELRIEEILRGNFEKWIEALKNDLSLSLSYLDSSMDALVEIYQRRNLVVHNGSTVNSIYLSKVKPEFRKNVLLNQKITVDKIYLEEAICKLQVAFMLVASELWKKLDASDQTRGEVISDIGFQNLLSQRWEVAEGLYQFLVFDTKSDPALKVVSQLNLWLCKKRLGKFKQIEKEVRSANYSDKKERFQLGLYSLREEKDLFFDLLPKALERQELTIEEFIDFPIFQEMRECEEYQLFRQESKYLKENVIPSTQ